MLTFFHRFREENTVQIDKKEDFSSFFQAKEDEIGGGFALCHSNEDPAVEAEIKANYNVTIRCIPMGAPKDEGTCLFTEAKSPHRVLFVRVY